ncbi:MAG: hypothetical protein HOB84_09835 [Candidatus Marinimicrobia bacterium]|jgi:hypothetical protein|nr:hypothetical protein [Candidatus Neomarinimicrobiota bacterium]MBT4361329.1 hypothetical protein [Candidatus Neomarinimicrobiota bacterium]MBT4715061.1 hypothetical protein [Candidatus Neomarinimicrobiota bacterium]MBT6012605.1 hypothetical protein [Candidatus Neomarinimicrobiota bacterium]
MAHSYTPGLKVLHETKVRKDRILPLKGDVVVEVKASVTPDDIVARTHLPGNVQMMNVGNILNIDPTDVEALMLKPVGSEFAKGEMIAETNGLFGFFKSNVKAPINCTLESISSITGQVVLRDAPIPVEVDAYIRGVVAEVVPEEGVIIETEAVFIQGIFGIGGESRGELVVVTDSREDELTADMIKPEHAGKVLVGGSFISLAAYKKALSMKVAGVVVGGFNYFDLEEILGYTLGVAITGSEDLVTSLVLTEGYGEIRMGSRTFDLLKQHHGKFTSINGATQIRAGVIRPEIVIPLNPEDIKGDVHAIQINEGIQPGSLVRVIRAPHFGRIGTVVSLPPELQKMESETMVRVAEIKIDDQVMVIPRANLEMVETD